MVKYLEVEVVVAALLDNLSVKVSSAHNNCRLFVYRSYNFDKGCADVLEIKTFDILFIVKLYSNPPI